MAWDTPKTVSIRVAEPYRKAEPSSPGTSSDAKSVRSGPAVVWGRGNRDSSGKDWREAGSGDSTGDQSGGGPVSPRHGRSWVYLKPRQ